MRIGTAIQRLCDRIMPGLDYLPWLNWAREHDYAETLLIWRNQQLFALVLNYFFPTAHWAEGKLLLIHPHLSLPDHLWILEHIRLWVRSRHRDAFGMPITLDTDFASTALLPHGFRLYAESMINMVKGDDPPDPGLHFVRYGG